MKLGIYVRVSTDEQAEFGISLADQHRRGIEHASTLGWEYEVFEDAGLSGTLPLIKRPGLNNLINKIQSNEIHGVYVANLDRLSRDNQLTQTLKLIFKQRKIKLFENSGETKLDDIQQELLLDIKSILASFEIKQTGKRISDKLVHNIKQGKVAGGQLQPYGFGKSEDKKLIINKTEAKIIKMIYELFLDGKGTKVIANTLNEKKIPTKMGNMNFSMKVKGEKKTEFLWRDAVIYNILKNPIYKGKRLYKGEFYDVEPIISPDVFDVVQSTLKNKRQLTDTTNKYFYLLKGVIHCSKCKNRFYGHKRANLKDNHYMCSSHRYKGEWCGTRGIGIDYLDELVWKSVKELPQKVKGFFIWYEKHDLIRGIKGELIGKSSQKKDLQEKVDKLLNLILEDDVSKEVKKLCENKITKFEKEIEILRLEQIELVKKMDFYTEKDKIISFVEDVLKSSLKKEPTPEQKRNIIRSLTDDVVINFNSVTGNHNVIVLYKINQMTKVKLTNEIQLNRFKRSVDTSFKNSLVVKFTDSELMKGYHIDIG